MIKTAIVEDEKDAADTLNAYIGRWADENGETLGVKIYDNAVTFLTDYRADADIVFLDIEMPMLDGMSAAEKLRETDPYVIIVFVTNMKQYAIRGYSVGALDFIVKPVSYAALSSLMTKARKLISSRGGSEITVGSGSAVRRVPLSRILYVEVSRHRLTYHTEDGDFETWGNLGDIEAELPADSFSRCNSCYLVSLGHVIAVEVDDVLLAGGVRLRISHLKKKNFLADLARYIGRR